MKLKKLLLTIGISFITLFAIGQNQNTFAITNLKVQDSIGIGDANNKYIIDSIDHVEFQVGGSTPFEIYNDSLRINKKTYYSEADTTTDTLGIGIINGTTRFVKLAKPTANEGLVDNIQPLLFKMVDAWIHGEFKWPYYHENGKKYSPRYLSVWYENIQLMWGIEEVNRRLLRLWLFIITMFSLLFAYVKNKK